MKKLSVIVLALVMVLSMVATAHAAPPAVEGQWKVDTVVYTETGAANMNENMPMPDFTWLAYTIRTLPVACIPLRMARLSIPA